MTNTSLLKGMVKRTFTASNKTYLKFPSFSKEDKSQVISRKICDYYSKLRELEGKTISVSEVKDIVSRINDPQLQEEYAVYQMSDFEGELKEDLLKEGKHLFEKYNRTKNSTFNNDDFIIVKISSLTHENNKDHYFFVFDDTKIKVKYNKMLSSFTWRSFSQYSSNEIHGFGFVSLCFLELFSKISENSPFRAPFKANYIIADYVRANYYEAYLDDLNNRISFDSGKTIATVRSDKKYQDTNLNRNTSFNDLGFRKVEVDTAKYEGLEFDYDLFYKVENDWKELCNIIPHTIEPELKFRKLGKHKAFGLYVPSLDIVAVDVRHTSSFIHEYGHHLDYTFNPVLKKDKIFVQDEPLSRQTEFQNILNSYVKKYQSVLNEVPEMFENKDLYDRLNAILNSNGMREIYRKKQEYYIAPTEIFARAFEIYVSRKYHYMDNSLFKPTTELKDFEYQIFKTLLSDVDRYFDNLFNGKILFLWLIFH